MSDKLIFDQEDFGGPQEIPMMLFWERAFAAKRAQEIYDRWLEKQPTVYGQNVDIKGFWSFSASKENLDTHTAKLVCIQELKTCEHPPEKVKAKAKKAFSTCPDNEPGCLVAHYDVNYVFECECGATVEPASYKVRE